MFKIKKNAGGVQEDNLQLDYPLHLYKIIQTQERLMKARIELIAQLSEKRPSPAETRVISYSHYQRTLLSPGETLLAAVKIKAKKTTAILTYKIVHMESNSQCSIDSINGDTRDSVIKSYLKNKDVVRYTTECMLQNKEGFFNINGNVNGWQERYAYCEARKKIFPELVIPYVMLEGKGLNELHNSKKTQREIARLTEDFTQELIKQRELADRPTATLISPNSIPTTLVSSQNPQVMQTSTFFKVTKNTEELTQARSALVKTLRSKSDTSSHELQNFANTYEHLEFLPGLTLLEAIKINLTKNKNTVFTYKTMKSDFYTIDFFIDSINGDTRPSTIKKHSKNREFIKQSTENVLQLVQSNCVQAEVKGITMLILDSNDPNWKSRYAYIKAREKLFPSRAATPLLFLAGKYTNADLGSKKLKVEIEKLIDNYTTVPQADAAPAHCCTIL
jgi:hypothetical protein